MASARQKSKLAVQLGMFLFEQGKLLTWDEYKQFKRVPARSATIRSIYGNWAKALKWVAQTSPNLWAEIQNSDTPKSEPVIDLDLLAYENEDEPTE